MYRKKGGHDAAKDIITNPLVAAFSWIPKGEAEKGRMCPIEWDESVNPFHGPLIVPAGYSPSGWKQRGWNSAKQGQVVRDSRGKTTRLPIPHYAKFLSALANRHDDCCPEKKDLFGDPKKCHLAYTDFIQVEKVAETAKTVEIYDLFIFMSICRSCEKKECKKDCCCALVYSHINLKTKATNMKVVGPVCGPASKCQRPSIEEAATIFGRGPGQPAAQPTTRSTSLPGTRPIQTVTRPTSQPRTRARIGPSTRTTTQPSTRVSTQPSTRPTTQPTQTHWSKLKVKDVPSDPDKAPCADP